MDVNLLFVPGDATDLKIKAAETIRQLLGIDQLGTEVSVKDSRQEGENESVGPD